MKFLAYIAAAGHALIAAAEHLEASPAGQTVTSDAGKTLSDASSAALSFVQQGAAQDAANVAAKGFEKLGVPAPAAALIGQFSVSQGESFLTSLAARA